MPSVLRRIGDGERHRLLLLFLRADVDRVGVLTPEILEEISYMPLDPISSYIREGDYEKDEGSVGGGVTPAQWLTLWARVPAEQIAEVLGDAENMEETFPALDLRDSNLHTHGDFVLASAGPRHLHTLVVAIAVGSLPLTKFVCDTYQPSVNDVISPELGTVIDVLKRSNTGTKLWSNKKSDTDGAMNMGNGGEDEDDDDDERTVRARQVEREEEERERACRLCQHHGDVFDYLVQTVGFKLASDWTQFVSVDSNNTSSRPTNENVDSIAAWLMREHPSHPAQPVYTSPIPGKDDSGVDTLPRREEDDDDVAYIQRCIISVYDHIRSGKVSIHAMLGYLDTVSGNDIPDAIAALVRAHNYRLSPEGGSPSQVQSRLFCQFTGCQRVIGQQLCPTCRITAYCGSQHAEKDADEHRRWCPLLTLSHTLTRSLGVQYTTLTAYSGTTNTTTTTSTTTAAAATTTATTAKQVYTLSQDPGLCRWLYQQLTHPTSATQGLASVYSAWTSDSPCSQHAIAVHTGEDNAGIATDTHAMSTITSVQATLFSERLSMVMSVAYSIVQLGICQRDQDQDTLSIYLLGSVREVHCDWTLLPCFLPSHITKVNIVHIGPDLEPQSDRTVESPATLRPPQYQVASSCCVKQVYIRALFHQAIVDGTLKQRGTPQPDIAVALNSGMHFYDSWKATVRAVLLNDDVTGRGSSSAPLASLFSGAADSGESSGFTFGFGAPSDDDSDSGSGSDHEEEGAGGGEREGERERDSSTHPCPLVVTAWSAIEAILVRHYLLSLGACMQDGGLPLEVNPWGSWLPQPVVDDHGSVNLSNAYIMGVVKGASMK